jgi:diguanylate cyclase (GGDEF)-like protein
VPTDTTAAPSPRSWGWLDLPRLAAGCAVVSIVYFAVSWPRPVGPLMTGWAVTWFCGLLTAFAGIRVVRDRAVAPAARRFWGRLAATVVVVDLGLVSLGHDAMSGPDGPSLLVSGTSMSLFMLALTMLLWTVLLVPAGRRSRGEWLTFALDAGTVATGSSLFLWHFSFRSADAWGAATGSAVSLLAIMALGGLGVLVLLKLAFAGVRDLDPGSLRLLSAAVLLAAGFGSVTPILADRPYLNSTFLSIPIGFCFVVLAAGQQQRAAAAVDVTASAMATLKATASATVVARRRSVRLSLLPYAAVALTDGLLLFSVNGTGDQMTVAVGVVVLTGLVVARQVITVAELRRSEDLLSHQASHDVLTGLANRALFGRRVEGALAAAAHPGDVAIALIDLDDFKLVNDRLGHIVGDALLIATADRLRKSVGPADLVARLGGDEFAILLVGVRPGDLPHRVQRILDGLTEPLTVTGQELLIRASLGIATGTPDANALELLRRADLSMYAAKDQGDGGWKHYEPDLDARADEQARVGAAIAGGLTREEFRVHYQPIVSLPDGQLVGVEALVRWAHPDRGLVAPDAFIPQAESTGLILPLGRWVLDEACRQVADWRDRYGSAAPTYISVNVSPRQLRDPELLSHVTAALDRSGLPPASLVIEVTETAVVDGGGTGTLHALRALGIRIALDDFGTGHSSLGLLLTCPVDILKVDKTFVDGATLHGDQAVIVTSLHHIAEGLHLQTIAEGVETAAQAAWLFELGYRQAQGYHFARPLPADQIEARLNTTGDRVAA